MTARELRNHLRDRHDIPTRGLDWAAMVTLHEYDHRPANDPDHNHDDGPNSPAWIAECAQFGCNHVGAARVAVLEYMVLASVVFLAAWLYVLAGR